MTQGGLMTRGGDPQLMWVAVVAAAAGHGPLARGVGLQWRQWDVAIEALASGAEAEEVNGSNGR